VGEALGRDPPTPSSCTKPPSPRTSPGRTPLSALSCPAGRGVTRRSHPDPALLPVGRGVRAGGRPRCARGPTTTAARAAALVSRGCSPGESGVASLAAAAARPARVEPAREFEPGVAAGARAGGERAAHGGATRAACGRGRRVGWRALRNAQGLRVVSNVARNALILLDTRRRRGRRKQRG